jgi:hypothetical protein
MAFPYFYHLTSAKNWPSIKRHGLKPHRNRLTKHGRKVSWLIAALDRSEDMALLKKFSPTNPLYEPIVIKVNAENVLVYKFGNTCQYYTPEEIRPKAILSFDYLNGKV